MIDSIKITGRQIDDKDKAKELETIIPGFKVTEFYPGVVTMANRGYTFEDICEKICDDYCKYPLQASQEELDEICRKCPLNQLI